MGKGQKCSNWNDRDRLLGESKTACYLIQALVLTTGSVDKLQQTLGDEVHTEEHLFELAASGL